MEATTALSVKKNEDLGVSANPLFKAMLQKFQAEKRGYQTYMLENRDKFKQEYLSVGSVTITGLFGRFKKISLGEGKEGAMVKVFVGKVSESGVLDFVIAHPKKLKAGADKNSKDYEDDPDVKKTDYPKSVQMRSNTTVDIFTSDMTGLTDLCNCDLITLTGVKASWKKAKPKMVKGTTNAEVDSNGNPVLWDASVGFNCKAVTKNAKSTFNSSWLFRILWGSPAFKTSWFDRPQKKYPKRYSEQEYKLRVFQNCEDDVLADFELKEGTVVAPNFGLMGKQSYILEKQKPPHSIKADIFCSIQQVNPNAKGDDPAMQKFSLRGTAYDDVLGSFMISDLRLWAAVAGNIFNNLNFIITGRIDNQKTNQRKMNQTGGDGTYEFGLELSIDGIYGDVFECYRKIGIPVNKECILARKEFKMLESSDAIAPLANHPGLSNLNAMAANKRFSEIAALLNTPGLELRALANAPLNSLDFAKFAKITPEIGSKLVDSFLDPRDQKKKNALPKDQELGLEHINLKPTDPDTLQFIYFAIFDNPDVFKVNRDAFLNTTTVITKEEEKTEDERPRGEESDDETKQLQDGNPPFTQNMDEDLPHAPTPAKGKRSNEQVSEEKPPTKKPKTSNKEVSTPKKTAPKKQ